MMILGLLLVCATGAFTGLLIADNLGGGPDYNVTILGTSLATMNSLEIFLSGVALGLLFCIGLWLLVRGSLYTRTARRTAADDVYAAPPAQTRRGVAEPSERQEAQEVPREETRAVGTAERTEPADDYPGYPESATTAPKDTESPLRRWFRMP